MENVVVQVRDNGDRGTGDGKSNISELYRKKQTRGESLSSKCGIC